jgi:hypothetical protein
MVMSAAVSLDHQQSYPIAVVQNPPKLSLIFQKAATSV